MKPASHSWQTTIDERRLVDPMAVPRQPWHGWSNLCAKSQAVYYEDLEEMLGECCVAEYSHTCWLSAT